MDPVMLFSALRALAERVPARLLLPGALGLTALAGALVLLVRTEVTFVVFLVVAGLAALQGLAVVSVLIAPTPATDEPPALRHRIHAW